MKTDAQNAIDYLKQAQNARAYAKLQEQRKLEEKALAFWQSATQRTNSRLAARRKRLLDQYAITPDDLDAMESAQKFRCAICGLDRPLHIDHCHATGRVRGLLCSHCNTTLGHMQDSPERLEAAADYLRKHH